ncbi:hypothetical protein E7T09_04130 [Deinococcus sp. KSM4-11]|uniref:hypothetical protein n=1 Tax=Deinococcus sp. KSM4-11 TaxID=2568654 RepID=UPI0010A4272D|nr:hypothetical protein [Deinococcus sp. KSM4-11]THF88402.1 hypothetical protein E7T09_04130 [Deinococcus sp. KSM4-11]
MDDDLRELQELAARNQRNQASAERDQLDYSDAEDRIEMSRRRQFMNVVRPAVERLGEAIRSLPGSAFFPEEDPYITPSYGVRFEVPGSRRTVIGGIELRAVEDDVVVSWNAHSVTDERRERFPLASLQVEDLYQMMLKHVRDLMK